MPSTIGLLFFFALSIPTAAQSVHVVDASGGGDFDAIPPALIAAEDGDLLLVRSGTYSGFRIENRAVSVVADTGANVLVEGRVQVENLAPSKRVVLAGLRVEPFLPSLTTLPNGAVELASNQGVVVLQDCSVLQTRLPTGHLAPAVTCSASDSVVITRCAVPTSPYFIGGLAANGLWLQGSSVFAFDSTFRAPDFDPFFELSTPVTGDAGTILYGSSLVVFSGSSSEGGRGGPGHGPSGSVGCTDGGTGGAGVELRGGAQSAHVASRGGLLAGGPGGETVPGCPGSTPGPSGPAVLVFEGSQESLAGAPVVLELPGLVRDGETASLVVRGAPLDLVWLVLSNSWSPSFVAGAGAQLFTTPFTLRFLGPLDASGELTRTLTASVPGATLLDVGVQVVAVDATNGARFGTGQAVLLLND